MLFGKKKKISKYLSNKQNSHSITAFDILLSEYLCGTLKESLLKLNFKGISFHIDWLTDCKCIGIQAKFCDYFFDIQINMEKFSVSYSKDEPDDAIEFELKDAPIFYMTLEEIICKILRSLKT